MRFICITTRFSINTQLMNITIHLTEPGTLKKMLPREIWAELVGLKITGVIGRKDFDDVLDELCTSDGYFDEDDNYFFDDEQSYKLRHLDLGEATYVDGTDLPYFGYHNLLESLVLPQGIKTTLDGEESSALEYSVNLTKLVLPEGLEYLSGFSNCPKLSELIIPESVVTIGCYAFENCKAITRIKIPANVKYLDGTAFADCRVKAYEVSEDNPNYVAVDGVIFSKDMSELVAFPCGFSGKKYVIPDTVRIIGWGAFMDCRLKRVIIPNSVNVIEDSAFAFTDLTEIIIPDSVEQIGVGAFRYSDALENLVFGKGISHVPERMLTGCKALTRIEIPGNVKIIEYSALCWADGLEEIILHSGIEIINNDDIPFIRSTKLKKVYIPDTIKKIDGGSFNYSSSPDVFVLDPDNPNFSVKEGALYSGDGTVLISVPNRQRKSFVVPHGTRIIDEMAFYDLGNLSDIELPDTLEDIKNRAFQGCDALRTLSIPNSLKRIDIDALWADNLKDIVLPRIEPPEMYGYLRDSKWRYRDVNVYVPAQSVESYKKAPGWKYFKIKSKTPLHKSRDINGLYK